MNINKTGYAFPTSLAIDTNGDLVSSRDFIGGEGLSKREYAAIQIMAGFAAGESCCMPCNNEDEINTIVKSIAIASVKWADALFNVLDKTEV